MSFVQMFVYAASPPSGLPLAGEEKRGMGRDFATIARPLLPLPGGGWVGVLKAGVIFIAILPIPAIYPLILQFFTKGTMSGALKG